MGSNDPTLETKVKSWIQSRNDTHTGIGPARGTLRFTENKGQMADLQDRTSDKCVADTHLLFKTNSNGVDLYITTSGLSYVFTKIERSVIPQLNNSVTLPGRSLQNPESTQIQYCRADMDLAGAVIKKENIIKEQESEDRTDYYLPHCPDGVLNVHSYEKITIKNIYPGIDWVLYSLAGVQSNESGVPSAENVSSKDSELKTRDSRLKTNTGGFKYDFVVHPGADPSLIQLRYKWADKPKLQRDGSVKVNTPMGDVMEGIPVSYQTDDHRTIDTHFSIQGNKLVFKIGKYNPDMNLVIDPALQWSTYFGGSATNGGGDINSISADAANVWLTGYSLNTGFPAGDTLNPGGGAYFQGKVIGSSDVIILQFTTCGKLIWATYYGGGSMDQGNSISSDGANIWVTGETQSTNFPTKTLGTAYNQSTIGGVGAFNAFVLQFQTSTGSRTWATYYGGSTIDFGYSINSDGTSVWITGETQSTNFPTKTLGTAYNQAAKGSGDAFVLQFSCANSSLTWASYYGGSGSDIGFSIQSDKSNVWVTGLTTSADFPLHPLGGAYNQPTLGGAGATNVFILQFSCVTSTPIWATYYGGSGGGGVFFGDEGKSISSDGVNVWLTGVSFSTDFPTKNPTTGQYFNGINSNPGNSGGTAFILQFNCANSSLVWGTFYGGTKSDIGYSIQSDGSNVWVCGGTSSTDFPTKAPPCGGFYQPAFGNKGTQEPFILQFNTSGIIQWATYFGIDGEDDGSYVSSNGASIFVAGDAQGPAASGTSYKLQSLTGAYYNTTLGTNETPIIAKFNIACTNPVITASPNTTISCNSTSALLSASGGIDYSWSPAAGLSSTTGSSVTASPTGTTTYTVTGTSMTSCVSQTATVTVTVSGGPSLTAKSNGNLSCTITSVTLTGISADNMVWNGGALVNASNPAIVAAAGIYTVTATDINNCSVSTTVIVTSDVTPPTIVSTAEVKEATCNHSDGEALVTGAVGSAYSYTWSSGAAGATASGLAMGTYTVTATDPANGCTSTSTVAIQNSNGPTAIVSNTTNICMGETMGAITVNAAGTGGLTYTWSAGVLGSGSTVSGLAAGYYTVTVTDGNGCTAIALDSILQFSDPVVSAGVSQTIAQGRSIQLSASGGVRYLWKPATFLSNDTIYNPTADPTQTTNYKVTITDVHNCSASDSVLITVVNCEASAVFIPTAFSPNADGKNDVLYVRGSDCITQIHLQVFDRWGELVFETTNSSLGWDGTFRGKVLNAGVFAYSLEAILSNGQSINKTGNITLLY